MSWQYKFIRGVAATAAGLLLAAAPCVTQAVGGEIEKSSLGFVPANVSFYYSMQSNREVHDRMVQSNAFARLQQSAVWQFAAAMWQLQAADPEGTIGSFMEEMRKPENVELTELALEMASDELFCYGDEHCAKLYGIQNDWYRKAWSQAIQDAAAGTIDLENPLGATHDDYDEKLLEAAVKSLETVEFPTVVAGCRIGNRDRAKRQLQRLETLLRNTGPPDDFKISGFGWKEIGTGEYLTVKVHGIPLPDQDADADKAPSPAYKKLTKMLNDMEFQLAIGIDRGFLLMSIGPDNRHLAQLGRGKRLVDQPEFAALRAAGERTYTHVSYTNQKMVEETHFGPKSVESWSELIKVAVASNTAGLDADVQKQWLGDIDRITGGIKKWFPQRGPRMSFSWLSERGFEGYRYNWDENLNYNGDDRPTMLDHVGGDPIFFWLTRHQYRPESWDPIFDLGQLLIDALERSSAEELGNEELVRLQQLMKEGRPLLDRAVKIYRENYSAGLADGQSAWVFDAKLTKHRWAEAMPRAKVPLPMFEFATVQSVSDAEQIKSAARQGIALVHEVQDLARKLDEGEAEPIQEILTPVRTTSDLGEFVQIPSSVEGLPEFGTTYGLSKHALVTTWTLSHAQRLLKPTPLKIEGPIMDHKGPAFDATYFNWSKLLDVATPWLAYIRENAAQQPAEPPADADDAYNPLYGLLPDIDEQTLDQIRSTIELLQCFQQYSSISYLKDDAQVTHYEWRFQDSPP